MNRFDAVQAWPALLIRPVTAAAAAASMSASESTNGSEPPSSSTYFFIARPATSPTARPARSDPVSDTPCTAGSSMIRRTWSSVANALA